MKKKSFGRFISVDPKICHGKPTILGTRILVVDVLDMVAEGRDWDNISAAWGGKVSKEAIAEAVLKKNTPPPAEEAPAAPAAETPVAEAASEAPASETASEAPAAEASPEAPAAE